MVFDKFSEQFKIALTLARQEALRSGQRIIGAEHLLLGTLSDPRWMAARIVQALNLELEQVRDTVRADIQPGDTVSNGAGETVEVSPHMKNAIAFALQEMERLGHAYLDTEHLLLGCLHEESGNVYSILSRLGVSLERARVETERLHALTQGVSSPAVVADGATAGSPSSLPTEKAPP